MANTTLDTITGVINSPSQTNSAAGGSIVEAIWQFLAQRIVIILVVLVALITIAAMIYGIKWILDNKYPKKRFLVIKPNKFFLTSVRTDGTQIIEDNIINILIGRVRKMNEELKDFEKVVYVEPAKMFFFFPINAVSEVYICTEVAGAFLPMNTVWNDKSGMPLMIPEEVKTGLAIGKRIYTAIAYTDSVKKSQEPLLMAIVHMLPLVIELILGIGGLLVIIWLVSSLLLDSSNNMKIASETFKAGAELLKNQTQMLPAPK